MSCNRVVENQAGLGDRAASQAVFFLERTALHLFCQDYRCSLCAQFLIGILQSVHPQHGKSGCPWLLVVESPLEQQLQLLVHWESVISIKL